jgi:hypothetical protein
METAQFVDGLQRDLRELAQIGGEELVQAARRLEGAVKQSATLRLIDVLTQVALELSEQLPTGHVDVRVAGQDPQLVYVEEQADEERAPAPAGDDEQTRITLRLLRPGESRRLPLLRRLRRAVAGTRAGAGGAQGGHHPLRRRRRIDRDGRET